MNFDSENVFGRKNSSSQEKKPSKQPVDLISLYNKPAVVT